MVYTRGVGRDRQLSDYAATNEQPDTFAEAERQALIHDDPDEESDMDERQSIARSCEEPPFSWPAYFTFMLLGVAMLWAWNMFLAAGPYFQSRLQANQTLQVNFQSAELAVSTVVNLGAMLILTSMRAAASYPKRILVALCINILVFSLLAVFTQFFLEISAKGYFGFLIVQIFASSVATGLMQNGIFAFMSGLGHDEYSQANMTGQAIAGVLPCIVQIVLVLSVPPPLSPSVKTPGGVKASSKSALAYFATATAISLVTLAAFICLIAGYRRDSDTGYQSDSSPLSLAQATSETREESGTNEVKKKQVPLMLLYRKTFYLSTSVFLTFAISMFFPVYTSRILSVRPNSHGSPLLDPSAFIPFAFLLWNTGDLSGRLLSGLPALRITHYPRLILCLASLRSLLIPLYSLCNVAGRGAKINTDAFYFVLQLFYGASNGYLATMCMMGAGDYVASDEREATGAFMTLMLVAGLTAGSLLSFAIK